MKRITLIMLILAIFFTGCARTAKIRRVSISEVMTPQIKVAKRAFTVGEKLTFQVAWKGIRVGTVTASVEEITNFEGYEVYKIVVTAKTNKFLSKLFKVEDTFTSYVDTERLISRHYTATRREGRYKKDLVVNYDFEKLIAYHKNLRDGSVKTSPIEENVQDPVSAAYYFRTIPIEVGDTKKIIVNLNEKNYEVFGKIKKVATIDLKDIGKFNAFLIKPYAILNGERLKKATAWGYFSADERRLGLYIVIKVLSIPFVGEVSATLENVEYITPSEN